MRNLGRFLFKGNSGSPLDGEVRRILFLSNFRDLKDYLFGYLLRVFFGWATFPLLSKA